MSLDALDTAEVGEVLRDTAADAFWDWYDETPEGNSQPPRGSDEARKCMEHWTCWLHESTGRELGTALLAALARKGYRVSR